jgi:hypothetical protein
MQRWELEISPSVLSLTASGGPWAGVALQKTPPCFDRNIGPRSQKGHFGAEVHAAVSAFGDNQECRRSLTSVGSERSALRR